MPVVSPSQSNTSRGHAHLLSQYYGINGDSPDGKDSPTTILSRKFDVTNARWTAEHSSIGTMALVIVVATTHFFVVATEDTEWRQFLSTLPEDSKLLYNMVSDFHGGKRRVDWLT